MEEIEFDFVGTQEEFADVPKVIEGYATTDLRRLVYEAELARERAYAPYSRFAVGAAGMFEDGRGRADIFGGANVENAAYSPTLCAETTSVARARFEGYGTLRAMAVYAMPDSSAEDTVRLAAEKVWCAPCGRCRQVIHEFAHSDCVIIMLRGDGQIGTVRFSKLFPMSFGPKNLGINPTSYVP